MFAYIRKEILPSLIAESANFTLADGNASAQGVNIAGYDLTSEFLQVLENLTLAQAQECFWRRAAIEKYKNAIVARLAIKVSKNRSGLFLVSVDTDLLFLFVTGDCFGPGFGVL